MLHYKKACNSHVHYFVQVFRASPLSVFHFVFSGGFIQSALCTFKVYTLFRPNTKTWEFGCVPLTFLLFSLPAGWLMDRRREQVWERKEQWSGSLSGTHGIQGNIISMEMIERITLKVKWNIEPAVKKLGFCQIV